MWLGSLDVFDMRELELLVVLRYSRSDRIHVDVVQGALIALTVSSLALSGVRSDGASSQARLHQHYNYNNQCPNTKQQQHHPYPSRSQTMSSNYPTRTPSATQQHTRLSSLPTATSTTSAKSRQLSHLNAQLAQLTAHMSDMENLLRMTAVQAEGMRELGGYAGGM